ncbi:uncharacterized protein LOC107605009 [Arachis ipaensis]|uniref:uncharacterized protein LOC107605009 n=1 Tax=Arachis ipaensis TaxID=130454 RepID=UPI0007AF70D5|nr:uncharacterized protein LOC107605009 [Arachis ipaensis]XP_025661947.1 uncharacterized protein LOC112757606 [Arachis hypogaea]
MIFMSWNCRGAASKAFSRTLRELTKVYKPDLVILMETRCSGDNAKKAIRSFGFDFYHIEEAQGYSGGIWIMWKDPNLDIRVVQSRMQFVHMTMKNGSNESWALTAVYASPQESRRKELWAELKTISVTLTGGWLVVGDFNDIAHPTEKKGGSRVDMGACKRFKSWIESCSLIDLGAVGARFTWRGPLWENLDRVFKRLDQALSNIDWGLMFPEARVDVLARRNSDHHPLLINTKPQANTRIEKPFRYEAMWSMHPGHKEFIKQAWESNQPLTTALNGTTRHLIKWNKDVFGHVGRQKRRLINRIEGIQRASSYGKNPFLEKLEAKLNEELEDILDKEEVLWMQKSRDLWVVDGDRNTRYYHTRTVIRRRRNKILKLKDQQGDWIEKDEDLKRHAIDFFKCLYEEENETGGGLVTQSQYPPLEPSIKEQIYKKPEKNEVKYAIFNIGSLKAPGPDGYPALFFKENWDIVKQNVFDYIQTVWLNPDTIRDNNATLITLIPKVKQPDSITLFRPISLCNVTYKCVSKIIVERLKPTLKDRISPYHSSYVPGRKIHDNILIAKEMTHIMKKMKGRRGFMAIKFDFEKAYDRVRWSFLKECLDGFDVGAQLTNLIMECVSSVSYNLLWNGGKTESFRPTRGIRQGDPISPYLFVIVMDKLSHLIEDLVASESWKPISVGRQGPKISHLLFADDLLVFAEANEEQIQVVMNCMKTFCEASGLKISILKTSVVFSSNVKKGEKEAICKKCNYQEKSCLGRYLGAMLTNHRRGKDKFKNVVERMQSKLKGWKMNCLSLAGRITLTKSVLSPMTNFEMQHSKLPKGLCNELERMQRSFIWGEGPDQKKIYHLNWNTLCQPKLQGGLGMRKIQTMNDAFLLKSVWRFIKEPEALWSQVLIHKYKEGPCLQSKPTDSPFWKDITKLWPTLKEYCSVAIGDGSTTSFWNDVWVQNEGYLSSKALTPIPEEQKNWKVVEYTNGRGEWDLENLVALLPTEVLNKIRSIPPPKDSQGEDRIRWNHTANGDFTVALAYRILINHSSMETKRIWKVIWRWKGPERIRVFMWQAAHGRLLTASRKSRMMRTDPNCHRCHRILETGLHALRDCPYAASIWVELVQPSAIAVFFGMNLAEWLDFNLSNQIGKSSNHNWIDEFFVACWRIWKWRNQDLFSQQQATRPRNAVTIIRDSVSNYKEAVKKKLIKGESENIQNRRQAWEPPPRGWVKLNTDGSVKEEAKKAGCGGLLRTQQGEWIGGFTANLGYCQITQAEMWAVLYGLQMAWNLGMRRVIVEMDAIEVLKEINTHQSTKTIDPILREIEEYKERSWEIKFQYANRETNQCADWLGKISTNHQYGFNFIDNPPADIKHLLQIDAAEIQTSCSLINL